MKQSMNFEHIQSKWPELHQLASKNNSDDYKNLFNSLSQKAFAGEL